MMKQLEQEMLGALDGLCRRQRAVPEAGWFVQTVCSHFSPVEMQQARPKLIVLGTELPWELTHAFGVTSRYVLGGSLVTCHASEQLLPRDADPVSRSACGYLLGEGLNLAQDALVVTTLASDNRRKLVGLLREQGVRVAAVDVPPDTPAARAAWGESLCCLAEDMERELKRPLTKTALHRGAKEYRRIRQALQDFRQAVESAPLALSGPLTKLVTECVWYAPDSGEFLRRLNKLTKALRRRGEYNLQDSRPWVLLAGSPVLFPNEKLPLLIESAGLRLGDFADAVSLQFDRPGIHPHPLEGVEKTLHRLATVGLPRDCSGGQCVNCAFLEAVEGRLAQGQIEGIIYHVLKGQIEWDFELERVEEIAQRHSIPVFRLETDYQPQDVEQLRIRVEAFGEMLREMHRAGEGVAQ